MAMNFRVPALVAGLFASMFVGVEAQAAQPTISFRANATVAWADPVLPVPGATVVSYAGNGTSDAQVRWGPTAGSLPSGYDVSGVRDGLIVYEGGLSPLYPLAAFRHVNGDAEPAGISGISLNITALLVGPRGFSIEAAPLLPFSHDETDNAPNPCPYGGANGQGINSAGCADRAGIEDQGLLQVISAGFEGRHYRFSFFGLMPLGSSFLTPEGAMSETAPVLLMQIETIPAAEVPEPGSWAMLIAGFGLVGAAARRRRVERA